MSYSNPLLQKEKAAEATVTQYQIMKAGAAAEGVTPSAAATDKSMGVAAHAAASGARVRVTLAGIEQVVLGVGGCAAGDLLTSDANGKAVIGVANDRLIGIAQSAGAAGDIIPCLLGPTLA